jgi:hypothetical protein
MALTANTILNLPSGTQQIIFSNPSEVDNITYSSSGITYALESSFILSQADMALYMTYLTVFYNALLLNFPSINASFNKEVSVFLIEIQALNGPNLLVFTQTSTASPITHVYTITFDRGAKTATFAARSSAITITPQEYLIAFQLLKLFFNQIALV